MCAGRDGHTALEPGRIPLSRSPPCPIAFSSPAGRHGDGTRGQRPKLGGSAAVLMHLRGAAARRSVELTYPGGSGLVLATVAGNGALTPGAGTNNRLLVTTPK